MGNPNSPGLSLFYSRIARNLVAVSIFVSVFAINHDVRGTRR